MAITRIKVSNFKSFDELEIDLRPLNVVVGGNASGKSNFLEIFRFLRDLSAHGLENAISLQGGIEYLANLQIGVSRPVALEVGLDLKGLLPQESWLDPAVIYKLSLRASGAGPGYEILEESQRSLPNLDNVDFPRNLFFMVNRIALLDFDPKLPKRGAPIAGKADLESDGSNLALVLKNLFQDEEKKESFTRLLRDLLPFVEGLKVESFLDRSLLLSLKESFGAGTFIPASFLSDGTLQMVALIAALYFEKSSSMLVLEEPDRNIHPHLISRLAGMMEDASANKQVIATTHNPELVKHTALEDLLLVHRDEHGFSRISRPAESEELKVFLENDLGVEDLYVQNLLDIGHAV